MRQLLFDRVLSGDLDAGVPLNEADLAASLGVSRTPVREALIGLEVEGLVRSDPGRGFFVEPLSEQAAKELYPLVGSLEHLALLECPRFEQDRLAELGRLDEQRLQARGRPKRRLELDSKWHATLLEECGNRTLLRVLDMLKRQLYRYEYVYMQIEPRVGRSLDHHRQIRDALQGPDVERAGRILEEHWRGGAELPDELRNRLEA